MPKCWFCEKYFPEEKLISQIAFDADMDKMIEVDLCEECSDTRDDGLIDNPNQDFN